MNNRIVRAISDASAELGHLSSALLLLDTCLAVGKDKVAEVQRDVGRELPVFEAISRQGMAPADIRRRLSEIVADIGEYIEEVDTLVVTAIEVELLDQIAFQYPELNIRVVAHDRQADRRRVESNFDATVSTIDGADFQDFAHPLSSALLVPGFDVNQGAVLSTYPTASRILGEDTRYLFSDIIGVDLLGNGFHFYPHGLVEVSLQHFTQILHVPVSGNCQPDIFCDAVMT